MVSSKPHDGFPTKLATTCRGAEACFLPHASPQQRLNFPEQPFVFSVRRFCFAPRVLRQAGRCRIGFDTPCRSVLASVRCNGYARGAELVIPEIDNSEDAPSQFFCGILVLQCSSEPVNQVRYCSEFVLTVSAFFTRRQRVFLREGIKLFIFSHLTRRHQACYAGF